MKKSLSTIAILAMLTITAPATATTLPADMPTNDSAAPGNAPVTEADRQSLWQRLRQWDEEKLSYSVQQPTPFEQLRANTGKDILADSDIQQRVITVQKELATINSQLGTMADYSQIPFYHSIIMLISRSETAKPLVWQMLTAFLSGDDETIYRLPYDKEAFQQALDYLLTAVRIRILGQENSMTRDNLEKIHSIVEQLRNGPEGIVPLRVEDKNHFQAILSSYTSAPASLISSELHEFLKARLGNNLYSSLFPGPAGTAAPKKWLSLYEKATTLAAEHRQLLFHLIDQAAEQGNILVDDEFSPSPYVDLPGECARKADFSFSVTLGCWCENDNRWVDENHTLLPLAEEEYQTPSEGRRFFFNINDVQPVSSCRPCYGILNYDMNNYCGAANLEGSLFWGAIVQ